MSELTGSQRDAVTKAAVGAPELARTRARSVATILAAGLGATLAGLVFTPKSVTLNTQSIFVGVAAFALLAISLAFFVAASMKTSSKSSTGIGGAKAMVESINFRTKIGSVPAVLALLLLAAIPILQHALGPTVARVTVTLNPELHAQLSESICPGLPHTFDADAPIAVISGGATMVGIFVNSQTCGNVDFGTGRSQIFINPSQANFVVVS